MNSEAVMSLIEKLHKSSIFYDVALLNINQDLTQTDKKSDAMHSKYFIFGVTAKLNQKLHQ